LRYQALKARDFQFDQPKITAKVGESVALRLENADTSTHYFEIDELNVHALMPPGESNLTLFTPTQPGTYRFYCAPHSDKQTGEGMVGTLAVVP
jgi:heme/copper-type cytochrome/quinol oxidase subunit 2